MTRAMQPEGDAAEDDDAEDDDIGDGAPSVAPTRVRSFAEQVGERLQAERGKRNLNQAGLAAAAGLSQQSVSRLERGRAHPSTALIERAFAALDLQVRLDVEPLGTDCDAEIDRYADISDAELTAEVAIFDRTFQHLADLPYVLTGRLGGLLQGAPLSVRRLDLVVAEADLDAYANRFEQVPCRRWAQEWNDFGYGFADPRRPGPQRYLVGFNEVQLEIDERLPRSTGIQLGSRSFAVRPLIDIEVGHPDIARVLRRVRARALQQPQLAVLRAARSVGAVPVEQSGVDRGEERRD